MSGRKKHNSSGNKNKERKKIRKAIRILSNKCCSFCEHFYYKDDESFCNLEKYKYTSWSRVSHGKIKVNKIHIKNPDSYCKKFKGRENDFR